MNGLPSVATPDLIQTSVKIASSRLRMISAEAASSTIRRVDDVMFLRTALHAAIHLAPFGRTRGCDAMRAPRGVRWAHAYPSPPHPTPATADQLQSDPRSIRRRAGSFAPGSECTAGRPSLHDSPA